MKIVVLSSLCFVVVTFSDAWSLAHTHFYSNASTSLGNDFNMHFMSLNLYIKHNFIQFIVQVFFYYSTFCLNLHGKDLILHFSEFMGLFHFKNDDLENSMQCIRLTNTNVNFPGCSRFPAISIFVHFCVR